MIRRATIDDLEEVLDVVRPYFKESFWGNHLTYSEEKTRAKFYGYLSGYTFVIDMDGIKAIATLNFDYMCSEELICDYEFFYVRKEARGTGVSRLLQEGCENFAKMMQARIMCACEASGVEDNLWVNLFKKYKFEKLGTVMVKVL
jgi:GNAT superfamily N-acetyltransferase